MGPRRRPKLRLRKHTSLLAFLCAFLSSVLIAGAQEGNGEEKAGELELSREVLEEVAQWFWDNPPNGENRSERRERMAVIQAACDQLSPGDYGKYVRSWGEDAREANALEAQHPALYYLQKVTCRAIEDIHRTKVEKGVALWFLYNMGYVFKTPDACFGIDIKIRDSEHLADVLDFLLITHEHEDHWSAPLLEAMADQDKPVLTRWYPRSTIVKKPAHFRFGSCRVKVDIGDHNFRQPSSRDNMLMFQVDSGESANNYTIYHSGDGNNFEKMTPDKPVDIFIAHVRVGMSLEAAIRHVQPRMTFGSHVLELGHRPTPPHAWRWSFDQAFETIKNFSEDEATVLTWGELKYVARECEKTFGTENVEHQ